MPGSGREEEREDGRRRRHAVPRADQGVWEPPPGRLDPVAVVEAQNRSRIADLVALRVGRMAQSPFAFLRGAALVMAHDLAMTPDTGLDVQVCGDAHLANFGIFASPERALLFDVDDFDETDVGPWEWDVKRLCASAAVLSRHRGHPAPAQRAAAAAAASSYRSWMGRYASMGELDLWYSRVDVDAAARVIGAGAGRTARSEARAEVRAGAASARRDTAAAVLPKLAALAPDGSTRIVDHPPLVTHEGVDPHHELLHGVLAGYLASLEEDRRAVVGRFEVADFARKVVGVGSVGTGCYLALLLDETGRPLLLQVKEADRSALDQAGGAAHVPGRHRGPGAEGRRVVDGQRRMQAASDPFLGWAHAGGTDFHVRQLRDMRASIDPGSMSAGALADYAALCGWVLARGHARSTGAAGAARIAGYLGSSDAFDQALGSFAVAYADQTEADHAALVTAVRAGRLPAFTG
ncbi:MAG: DUF2252 domain-containing protein [Acidobacteriota bacterium]|nr:DUF2252 domain-containing protein [Acidobacteriota bacterium]